MIIWWFEKWFCDKCDATRQHKVSGNDKTLNFTCDTCGKKTETERYAKAAAPAKDN